jgi:5-methylcytosine-specific restriction enzyme subunit McrC
MPGLTVHELKEYEPTRFSTARLPVDVAQSVWRNHASKISVEFPSIKTEGQTQLTSEGWVGYLPLSPTFAIRLSPKVQIANVFRMLEYAYELAGFDTHALMNCGSLEEFFDSLAAILARQVLHRSRVGLYRSYVEHAEELNCVRGRLDLLKTVRSPSKVALHCQYGEQTADIEDNQMLAWTLWCVARSSCCTERSSPLLRQAYRALAGQVSLLPTRHDVLASRGYNRLNDDYRPMHALCAFFLRHLGPVHAAGENQMLPFLVNMASLYELFVARWLETHPPTGVTIKRQVRWTVGASEELYFKIDLVLFDVQTGRPICVLDTKYKAHEKVLPADVAQVTTYALGQDCHNAVLVYPIAIATPLDERIGKIRVRSFTFALDGDLERNGLEFRGQLLAQLEAEKSKAVPSGVWADAAPVT